MNVYIDLGANKGDTVLQYLKDNPFTDIAYAFEANPELYGISPSKLREYDFPCIPCEVHWINAAVTTRDGAQVFFIPKNDISSSLYIDKFLYRSALRKCTVCTIDFPSWFVSNIVERHIENVTMKCDIEGSEYDILPPLLSMGLLGHFEELIVEFHQDRILTQPFDFAEKFIEQAKAFTKVTRRYT